MDLNEVIEQMKNDPRNYLFENYEKILNHFKPSIFLFENVTGLLTAKFNNKKVIDVIKEKLGKNYKILNDTKKMVLNSCEYGVPQIRKRVFLIGIRKDINYDAYVRKIDSSELLEKIRDIPCLKKVLKCCPLFTSKGINCNVTRKQFYNPKLKEFIEKHNDMVNKRLLVMVVSTYK